MLHRSYLMFAKQPDLYDPRPSTLNPNPTPYTLYTSLLHSLLPSPYSLVPNPFTQPQVLPDLRHRHCGLPGNQDRSRQCCKPCTLPKSQLTNPPGHLWRDDWTSLSGPHSTLLISMLDAWKPHGLFPPDIQQVQLSISTETGSLTCS